ncbi:MAG: glycosyltransferase family 2 protein [Candidatus Binatia bacterium]
MNAPVVSIVIRCRDEARHLGPVLAGVLAQQGAPPFEVVALDSGSTDGTLEVLARHPVRVEHLAAGDFTYGRALNVGAAHARGVLVVYLSAHCRPLDPTWLAVLVAPFADPAVTATFGRQVPLPGVNPIEALATARNFPPAAPAGVLFSTANGAVRRAAVLARPFDEAIPIAEDHVWALGVVAPERIAYVPDAAVGHSHPMGLRHWHARFFAHGLAAEYARRRRGLELPWGAGEGSAGQIARSRAGAFLQLARTLARQGEGRALAHLPAYALARTRSFARGVKEGARRYGRAT